MHQKLLQDFLCFTNNIKSPLTFIQGSFYWLIGAALQRRVWLSNPEMGPWPNLYIGLCGGPGVGKGIIIKPTVNMLTYHKLSLVESNPETSRIDKMLKDATKNGATPETIMLLEQSKQAMICLREMGQNKAGHHRDEKLLFPVGADSTTFQSMVQEHGGAVRIHHGTPCAIAPSGTYLYHSIVFALEEASSLFEENAKRMVDYLLKAYDCGDYSYKTKTQGQDIIKRSSLSLLFGTTPEFVRSSFSDSLFTEGFSSRTIFIYGKESRFEDWKIPEATPEQAAAKNRVLVRLKELSELFGQCSLTPEAEKLMDDYFKGADCQLKKDMSKADDKLKHYFARKNIHVQKLSMCIHFADSSDLIIPAWCIEKALEFLGIVEETMIYCLNTRGFNPAGDISRRIHKFIKDAGGDGMLYSEIVVKFGDDANMSLVDESLKLLELGNKIKQEAGFYVAI